MLTTENLRSYQKNLIETLKEKEKLALFIDMGYGKTIVILTHLLSLLKEGKIKKALILTSLRIANGVWNQESKKWNHTKELRISIGTGSLKEKVKSFEEPHDILVTNKEFTDKLIDKGYISGYDCIVIDESTAFKNNSSLRFKKLSKAIGSIKYRYIISGSAYSNDLIGLWAQIYLLDSGARLGKNKKLFLREYYHVLLKMTGGYAYNTYIIKEGSQEKIKEKIKDLVLTITGEDIIKDYKVIKSNLYYEFPREIKEFYKTINKEGFYDNKQIKKIRTGCLDKDIRSEDEEGSYLISNGGAKINKMLQICNGAVYEKENEYIYLHNKKVELLKELIESIEDNFLIFIKYKFDYELIKKGIPYVKKFEDKQIEKWNDKCIKAMVMNPKSCGHGLNLQYGGSSIVWYGLTYSYEEYEQSNARLIRIGQDRAVRIFHLLNKESLEPRLLKILETKKELKDIFSELLKNE